MAWFTEQILADFLNKCEDFEVVKNELSNILADDVVLYFGTREYRSKSAVIDFFEGTANAISTEFGFYAVPVIICDTEDSKYGIHTQDRRKAVALHSKLEEYISWFFMIKCNDDFKINRIDATQGLGYQYYNDYYVKQEYTAEGNNEKL